VRYVVNVEVALRRDDSWLLIVRSPEVAHAAGLLSNVGGRLEAVEPSDGVLESTARREVAEEVGVDLTGVPLSYVDSTFFVADTGNPVLNVVFAADLPHDAEPVAAAPDEVAAVVWCTVAELESNPSCPPWTLMYLRRAVGVLPDGR
jgi:8-oxo-dGTP pyrophosphatase MutT (NUDIX family)